MSLRLQISRLLRADPDRVFGALMDLDELPRWLSGEVRIEPLTTGTLGKGSAWRETRNVLGRQTPEERRVTRCEPGRCLEVTAAPDGDPGRHWRVSYNLHPEGEGTRVVLVEEVGGPRPRSTAFRRFFLGPYRELRGKDLLALGEHLATDPVRRGRPSARRRSAGEPSPASG